MFDFFMFYMYTTFVLVVLALVGFMIVALRKEPAEASRSEKAKKRMKKG